MEIRYATPYVSGLSWVLNEPITENVPVQNESGQPRYKQVVNEPGLTVEVTPYLNNIAGQMKTYSFMKGAVDGTAMEDILTNAGMDVAAQWASALDSMANIFPLLEDPAVGAEDYGPAFYMRLDAWRAILPWEGNRAVVATLGIYDTETFDNVQAYVQLVFADGQSLRQIEDQKVNMQNRIDKHNAALNQTVEGWENMEAEEQQRRIEAANNELPQLTAELNRLNSQLVAPLNDLLSLEPVQTSIGALLTGVFTVLKNTQADYANTDPAAIMSKFVLPDVS